MWLTNGTEVNRNKKKNKRVETPQRTHPMPGQEAETDHDQAVPTPWSWGRPSVWDDRKLSISKILKSIMIGNSHLAEIFHLTLEARDR